MLFPERGKDIIIVSLAAAGLSGMGQKRASRLTVLRLGSFGASVAYCIRVGPMNG